MPGKRERWGQIDPQRKSRQTEWYSQDGGDHVECYLDTWGGDIVYVHNCGARTEYLCQGGVSA